MLLKRQRPQEGTEKAGEWMRQCSARWEVAAYLAYLPGGGVHILAFGLRPQNLVNHSGSSNNSNWNTNKNIVIFGGILKNSFIAM